MSKEYKNIDELFKSQLGQMDQKAPAHVKPNIDKALGFKKRRGGIWFFIIPALLIAGTIPFVLPSGETDKEDTQIVQSDPSHSDAAESENNPIVSSNSDDSNNTSESIYAEDENFANEDDLFQDASQSIDDSPLYLADGKSENQTNVGNYEPSRNQGDLSSTKDPIQTIIDDADEKMEGSDQNDNLVNNQNDNGGENTIQTSIPKGDSENELVSDNDINNESDKSGDSELTDTDNNLSGVNDVPLVNEELEQDSLQSEVVELNEVSTIDSTDLSLDEKTEEEIDTTTNSNQSPQHSLDPKDPKYKGWFISGFAGVNLKNSNITSGNDTLDQEYQSSISDKGALAIGLDVNYRLKNGLMFGSGVQYSKLKEDYAYQKSIQIVTDTTYSWNVTLIDSIQDSVGYIYIYDSTLMEDYTYGQQDIYNQSGTNTTTFLHIPFRLGYQYILNKWRFDFIAQGRFNWMLRSTSTYIVNDQLVTNTVGGFKNSYFDLELGLNAHYNIWNNLYVSAFSRYKPPLRTAYYSPTISNKFQHLYLGLGLSINL